MTVFSMHLHNYIKTYNAQNCCHAYILFSFSDTANALHKHHVGRFKLTNQIA